VELQYLPRAKAKDGDELKKPDVETESKYFPSISKRKKLPEAEDEDLLDDSMALAPEVKTKENENRPLTRASKRRKAEEDESPSSQVKEQPPPKRTRKSARR